MKFRAVFRFSLLNKYSTVVMKKPYFENVKNEGADQHLFFTTKIISSNSNPGLTSS